MPGDRMHCTEVFLRHTRGSFSHISQHQCWDADRFIAAVQDEARKEPNLERREVITLATRDEYRDRHWKRRSS